MLPLVPARTPAHTSLSQLEAQFQMFVQTIVLTSCTHTLVLMASRIAQTTVLQLAHS